jgi:putative nucleotide binding protein
VEALSSKKFEEYAYILDYLPHGHPLDRRPMHLRKPVALAVGEDFFTLLELSIKEGVVPSPGERVFIGRGLRDKVEHISRRVSYDELTAAAKDELVKVIDKMVSENERKYVEVFNKAPPLTTRMHSLELIRGIGKKKLRELLEERKKRPFESFKDLEERVGLRGVAEAVKERILEELKGGQRYYLFVRPAPKTAE